MAFAFQDTADRARSLRGWALVALCRGHGTLRTLTRPRRGLALLRRLDRHAGAARLRQADRDRLLRRARAVLAFADVLHFLADEFAGLRAGGFPGPAVLAGPLESFLVGHGRLLFTENEKVRPPSSPAVHALPAADAFAPRKHLVAFELRGGRARMVGKDAHDRPDGEALEVDRPPAAARDDAVLLVGVGDDQILDRLAVEPAHDAVALVYFLPRGAAVARERHPPAVGEEPVLLVLVADDARGNRNGDVVERADAEPGHDEIVEDVDADAHLGHAFE